MPAALPWNASRRRRQRAPVQVLFNQKGSEMRQVMTVGPHGVGRTSRSVQVCEELPGHLFKRCGLNRRRWNLNVGHAERPSFQSTFEHFHAVDVGFSSYGLTPEGPGTPGETEV